MKSSQTIPNPCSDQMISMCIFLTGDLVKYKEDILIITGFGPYESPFTNRYNVYHYINLTTNIARLKQGNYTADYLDKMGEKVG